ncbi:MAG: hypothetical protein QOD39_5215 [Mycobacterium sp.]|jgi:outer membrane murein-binding lipoprotein Lpp|nr:hypothetical protein [Mycobacterium sp.]
MRCRFLLAAVVATVVMASGCSGSNPPAQSTPKVETPSAANQTSQAAPAPATTDETDTAEAAPAGPTLDNDACVDITGANLNLAVATDHDAARSAGDTFENYNLPSDVRAAIEHFVSTGGAQYKDPDYDRYNKLIDEWVKQVCPL